MNKPVLIINTFKTIKFDEEKKPIVICDIDKTFIRPEYDYDYYHNLIKNDYHNNPKQHDLVTRDILNTALGIGMVKQTDKEGFLEMLDKIKKYNGKLIFLTARSAFSHEKTVDTLKKVGLENPEQFEIHYTGNNITKGHYIKNFDLLKGYQQHIFIDDYPHFLESALKIYPNMDCYLFKYD